MVKDLSFRPNVDSRVGNSSRYHFQGLVAMVISVALLCCFMLAHFQCANWSSAQVHITTHPFRAIDLRHNFSHRQFLCMYVCMYVMNGRIGLTKNRINMTQTHLFFVFVLFILFSILFLQLSYILVSLYYS